MKQRQDQLQFEIRKRKLEFLVNKLKSSNWGNLLMAITFCYFYWHSAPREILYIWLLINFLVCVARALFVYPRYFRTEVTMESINAWSIWFTFTIGINGVLWAVAFLLFFVPDDSFLVLILMFTFFVLMTSGTTTLASHMPGFLALIFPIVTSMAWLFYFGGETIYTELSIAFILFSLLTLSFFKTTNEEITQLITLQLERKNMVEELEVKSTIADENRLIAEKSVEEKNHFLAAASHDLRQPLHASGLLLAALKKHVTSTEGKQLLKDVINSNSALGTSFNSLLDMSKLEAGVIEVNDQDISLTSLMAHMQELFTNQAEEKGLTLSFSGPDLAIHSDKVLQERIIRNLISNAIKYTDKGSVEVCWDHDESSNLIEITISDTGIGIAETELHDIFSEYYQIHNTERDRSKGFGLGLAIVKQLCALLDVDLSVDSRLGSGTTFRLKMPLGEKPVPNENPESFIQGGDLSNITILVIDDDKSVLSGMKKLLTSWSCEVLCAETGQQASEIVAAATVQPHMILTDYRLRNNETGVQACEKVFEELNRTLPTLIITGDTSPDRLKEVVDSGYSLLHKPVEPAELRTFMQRHLVPILKTT
ncbi:MAG: response regulator [Acidiferrobacterales bacterium]|nr:response regulator [Acidiferrobacterales bacterium]